MVTRAISHEHDVVVVVDDTRHYGASLQVDDPSSSAWPRADATHRGEASVPDRDGVDDGVVAVHGMDPAIDEDEFLTCCSRARSDLLGRNAPGRLSEHCCDARRNARSQQLPA